MRETRRAGGIAALVAAATFLFGIAMFVTVMADYTATDATAADAVGFVVENQFALYAWYSVVYLLFGAALVFVTVTLHDVTKIGSQLMARISAAFGFIWAGLMFAAGMVANIGVGTVIEVDADDPDRAQTVWVTIDSVLNGLGGGNEIVGGLWVLLVSWTALRAARLPSALCYLGLLSAAAGLVTIVPALETVGAVFGIGLIVWFAWLGTHLLRSGEVGTTIDLTGEGATTKEVAAAR